MFHSCSFGTKLVHNVHQINRGKHLDAPLQPMESMQWLLDLSL